jgi:hypothetical protein
MKPTSPLGIFYKNTIEREAVKEFLVEQLKHMAVEKTFDGLDVTGIKEARNLIELAFDELEALYGEKPEKKDHNSR